MMRFPMLAAFAAALLAAPAAAAPDAATLAAARLLAQQTDVRGQIAANMARLTADLRNGSALGRMLAAQPGFNMARARNPQQFDDVLKKVGTLQAGVADKVIAQQLPGVVEAAIQSYATHYTAAELKGLAEFYRSPLGQALTKKQPLVARDLNAATAQLMGTRVQAAMKSIQPQIEAELKRLQPPPAAKP